MKKKKKKKTHDRFEIEGCHNCESVLRMAGDRTKVIECTSNQFTGMIALMSPEASWVAKWQRLSIFFFSFHCILKVYYFLIFLILF